MCVCVYTLKCVSKKTKDLGENFDVLYSPRFGHSFRPASAVLSQTNIPAVSFDKYINAFLDNEPEKGTRRCIIIFSSLRRSHFFFRLFVFFLKKYRTPAMLFARYRSDVLRNIRLRRSD